MFSNVLMTSLTSLKDMNEFTSWENRPFSTTWPEPNQHTKKDTLITKITKKKNKRNRTAYTTDQLRVLENTYNQTKYVDAERRKELAKQFSIDEKCIKVWFQNRRMKEKKESSESSCDSSSESSALEPVTPPPSQTFKDTVKLEIERNYSHEVQYHNNQGYILPEQQRQYDNAACQFYNNFNPTYNSCNNYVPSFYFQNDTNVYPTQYYPTQSSEYHQTDQFTTESYSHYAYNEWNANSFDINDFQT